MATKAEHGGRMVRIGLWTVAALLLLAPLVAMHFTNEVNWTGSDFVFAAILIGGVGLAQEFAVRVSRNPTYRAGAGLALAATFLLIWVNGAVGIIGDEDNPLNLLYGGVLLLALGGTIGAGGGARGMMRAMIAPAAATALVGVVAVNAGGDEPPGAVGLVMIHGFFVGLWLLSAFLFRKASRDEVPSRS